MYTISAVIRVRSGYEDTLSHALAEVARHVAANEPDTLGFFISRDVSDPCVMTTYERFRDKDAMDRHNNSDACARFFEVVKPILDGDVVLVTANEISAKL
ncbi:antibiotic biosynthesis monooxygenase [Paracoccus sp. MBLB3053]|uniref:Antibiotic biosynthesis monooxygenase n=1 Tax=Paracoccus aurantius TaxID=3073814 RepID=A0ABU2HUS1_9RHOB|nr:antibiotic biosynthesis monooxygenase [Paracoccus sp. MBLB3053]MDS9468482.1 antibiotic biosynthesis monooxygenase [Paracoccus sp. MBLB3053]